MPGGRCGVPKASEAAGGVFQCQVGVYLHDVVVESVLVSLVRKAKTRRPGKVRRDTVAGRDLKTRKGRERGRGAGMSEIKKVEPSSTKVGWSLPLQLLAS